MTGAFLIDECEDDDEDDEEDDADVFLSTTGTGTGCLIAAVGAPIPKLSVS